jgi:glycosyltransferase involved in cell wall biosynthesis
MARDAVRILHVVPTYLPAVRYGGPITTVHGLCRALVARGHEAEVITTNVNGSGTSQVPLGVPVPVDSVSVRYFGSPVLRRLSWAPSLASALRAEISRFDVVHLHSVFLWPTWAAARLARRAHVPHLISPRGMLFKDLIDRRSRLAKSIWIRLIERNNLEGASIIHATSDLEADELRRLEWRLPRIATIPNGVDDIGDFERIELSDDVRDIAATQPYILFLGRISWKKGLDRLLRACVRVRPARLVIAGPDDERLIPQLSQLAHDLQIGDRVRFLPRTVLGADKERLYASAQAFVLPSYSENFGNTVLEAMLRGQPVIVTPEVGAAAIVRQCGGGLVVDGDPLPLGAALERLINNPALALRMGAAGRCHIRNRYGWPDVAAQMEALYDSIKVRSCSTTLRQYC